MKIDAKKKLDDEFESRKTAFEKKVSQLKTLKRKDDLRMPFEKEEQQFANESSRLSKLDVVVFFDEANTTDAIGLIKEIMCDRRLNGRPISDDLKFIAACNPYRK